MKIKNKGFTLIELLATIAVLSLVVTITGIVVVGSLSKNKEDLIEVQKKNIISTAKAYFNDNLDTYTTPTTPDGCSDDVSSYRSCTIYSNELVDDKYIEKPKDMDNNEINYKIDIKFKLENGIVSNLTFEIPEN